jgi:hypothetical protein
MSKYIIELDDRIKLVTSVGVTENGVVYTTSDYVHNLEELTSDYINEHFGDLQDTAYQKGLAEGREQMPCDTCAYRHNELLCADCKWNYGSRYKVDSIGVGDVVKTYNGITFIVTKATTDGIVVGFEGEGNTCRFALSEVTKTGEHYNINEILGGLCDD